MEEQQKLITITQEQYDMLLKVVELAEKQKEELKQLRTPVEGLDMDRLNSLVDSVEVVDTLSDAVSVWEDR